jgi:hypothetical protein
MVFGAAGDVLTQVQRVGLASQAAVAGQEPDQRFLFGRTDSAGRIATAVLVVEDEASMSVPP